MGIKEIRAFINALGRLLGWLLVAWILGWVVVSLPYHKLRWYWDTLGTNKPEEAYECLDLWRDEFNDPEAAYVYHAELYSSLHMVDVEIRGKNKMGAFVKGYIVCALKQDGDIDYAATKDLKITKMMRPEDGEVPP